MDVTATSFNLNATLTQTLVTPRGAETREFSVSASQDTLTLGTSGPISPGRALEIVTERALEQLRSVLETAREELGLSEDAVLDTSPEATADRILDFALGLFDRFLENHPELSPQDGRAQFADFIGGAISQGVQEARDILGALSVLSPDIDANIDRTMELIEQGLNAFAVGDA